MISASRSGRDLGAMIMQNNSINTNHETVRDEVMRMCRACKTHRALDLFPLRTDGDRFYRLRRCSECYKNTHTDSIAKRAKELALIPNPFASKKIEIPDFHHFLWAVTV